MYGNHVISLITVFQLTHLPEAQDKLNWIWTSENFEKFCFN
jgi:hypothetical protein